MFVTGRIGKVWVLRGNKWQKGPLLDIRKRTDPLMIERGLLGLAFAPDFRTTGRFYIYFTRRDGDAMVEEYRTIPGPARCASARTAAGPFSGSPGSMNSATTTAAISTSGAISSTSRWVTATIPAIWRTWHRIPTSLRGKILRIDPRKDPVSGRAYRIPAGNPFVGIPGRDEVFAMGLRNPHSFNFSTSSDGTSMMAIYDVGQSRFEELNYLPVERRPRGQLRLE